MLCTLSKIEGQPDRGMAFGEKIPLWSVAEEIWAMAKHGISSGSPSSQAAIKSALKTSYRNLVKL